MFVENPASLYNKQLILIIVMMSWDYFSTYTLLKYHLKNNIVIKMQNHYKTRLRKCHLHVAVL